MATGKVLELRRYPVKSMGGERLTATRLGPHGVGGDRVHALTTERDGQTRRLTAREAPRLLAWRAAYPFAQGASLKPQTPPVAAVTSRSGRTYNWADPRLRAALEDDIGERVRFIRDPGGVHGVSDTLLVTTEATRAALERSLGGRLELLRFRPNLHLELDCAPWAELDWAGATLTLGDGVTLKLVKPCKRCVIPTRDPKTQEKCPELLSTLACEHGQAFGIYGRVTTGGRVQVGDAALLTPAAGAA